MAEYKKTIILNEPAALRQKLTNWAIFNKVKILDSMFLEEGARFEGKKDYREKVRFRVRILFLWFFVGILMSSFIREAIPSLRYLWILPPLGYVAYYFIRRKSHIVELEIRSIGPFDGSPGPPTLIISASADFDEVKADINSLLMMLT